MKRYEFLSIPLVCLLFAGCASVPAASFETPQAAVQRLVTAADDPATADELLGPGGFSLLRSGDDVSDREDLEFVRSLIEERLEFLDVTEDCKIALLGTDHWEFPIPLTRVDGHWRFDVEAGREEILNRRVGRNELSTLATLLAIVEAQREYVKESRDGQPASYASHFMSKEGLHDGLYWPVSEGQDTSPLGPLIASAASEGYRPDDEGPTPYHGYFYRMLTEQSADAPGGARQYLDEQGHLIDGFAVLAWPATYGNSGVMTFLVNRLGIVFEKDLGRSTPKAIERIQAFGPDRSWSPVAD